MDKYDIILPNEKKNTFAYISVLISVINIIGFAYNSIIIPEPDTYHYLSIIGFATAIPPLLRFILVKSNLVFPEKIKKHSILKLIFNNPQEDLLMTINIAFFFSALIWFLLEFYLIFFLLIIFALSGMFALRKLIVVFGTKFISYPSFPRKKITWNEVSNLILKDNILTIDLKNNNLIQHTINENENKELDEAAFNEFVKNNIGSKK